MSLPSNEKFIYGFGISYFRSFGEEEQVLGPFKKINVIIGRNNSGKSNVLRFIRDAYWKIVFKGDYNISNRDAPRNINIDDHNITITYPTDEAALERFIAVQNRNHQTNEALNDLFDGQFKNIIINYRNSHTEFSPKITSSYSTNQHVQTIWSVINRMRGGDFNIWLSGLTQNFKNTVLNQPRIKFIGAYRKYDSRLEEYKEDNGEHINSNDKSIETLMALYQPAHYEQSEHNKFLKIQNFIREVTGESTLKIQVPHDVKTINVHLHNKVLPIEALGTGIHELLIFAIQVISIDNHVVCIEEPELHFHPHMQRQLMRFLSEQTTNQYFITTHSAHVMDAVQNATIHTVTLEDGFSKVSLIENMNEKRRICQDLGYFPSDLLQSNSIIWVEGPSDRIYLKYWIAELAPELEENLHYSIMFYGGALLSHLSVDDSEVDDLIKLLSINRFPLIMIDSDLKSDDEELRDTKKRVIAEFEKIDGIAWITKGREIENYISSAERLKAIKAVHKSAVTLEQDNDEYSKPLNYINKKDEVKSKGFNKVAIAKKVIEQNPSLDVLDLKERLEEMIAYINSANS